MRHQPTSTSPDASGSPQINLLPPGSLGDAGAPVGAATMGIRPEHLVVGQGGAPARAITVEHLGAETVALLETPAGEVHVLLGPADRLMPGEQTTVHAPRGAPLYFDEAGALLPSGQGRAAAAPARESVYGG